MMVWILNELLQSMKVAEKWVAILVTELTSGRAIYHISKAFTIAASKLEKIGYGNGQRLPRRRTMLGLSYNKLLILIFKHSFSEVDDALDELEYLHLQKQVKADDDRDEHHNKVMNAIVLLSQLACGKSGERLKIILLLKSLACQNDENKCCRVVPLKYLSMRWMEFHWKWPLYIFFWAHDS